MARTINRLSAAQVAKATRVGRFADGGGLYLQVSQYGSKAWIYRYMIDGKARHMGLGSVATFSLQEARLRARAARQLVADGIDPIAARNEKRATTRTADAKQVTFAEAADRYIAAHAAGWRNAKSADQWRRSLAAHAAPIANLSVAAIGVSDVLKVVEPIWSTKTVTANRVRGRIESILDWARVRHLRGDGENPARWKGHLDHLLPARNKMKKIEHLAAMPHAELPAFMARLRERDGIPARALEFAILCAARTGEVVGAKWNEIDLDSKTWTIPGDRMKSGREYRVPLTGRTLDILATVPRLAGSDHIFPGTKKGGELSHAALRNFLSSMDGGADVTVHGFRSSFRDWCSERTNFPREIAEAALAHVTGDATERAYRRSDALERRRKLMEAWAKFCAEKPAMKADNVVLMQAKA